MKPKVTVAPKALNITATTEAPEAVRRNPFIRLDPQDNVVVARMDVPAGTPVSTEGTITLQHVPAGHKMATRDIAHGEPIRKYNTTIGFATEDIAAGTWMHSHNIGFGELAKDYRHGQDYVPTELLPPAQRARFAGIVRADGRVATRNYIGVFIARSPATSTRS